jgi:hypothetical protein
MFFLTILLIYSLSTIYTYFRISTFSFFHKHKTRFTLSYISMVLGGLIPEVLSHQTAVNTGWGYKRIGNTHFFVTSGIRVWGPPVRTVGDSEIMVIDVDFIPAENQ